VSIAREDVVAALSTITDPESGQDLMAAGVVRALTVGDGVVRFVLDAKDGPRMEPARKAAVVALEALEGVDRVIAVATAHVVPKPAPDLGLGRAAPPQGPQKIPGVSRILAVASGKGGVGKSTISANLAVALAAEGRRVGMLDADVYGPSQPRILGMSGRPAASPDGKTIMPLRNHGVTMMSIGLMVPDDEAVIWRGPLLMGALQQLLNQVEWGRLDVLIVDLPPGTGDIQITLAQKAELSGAVVVSTPQDLALLDVRKAIAMFAKTGVRVVGMIENMSTHICSNCGHEEHIFGHGGARDDAERLGIPFLGAIPLDVAIRQASDGGAPVVVSEPDGPNAGVFRDIARKLIAQGVA